MDYYKIKYALTKISRSRSDLDISITVKYIQVKVGPVLIRDAAQAQVGAGARPVVSEAR